MKDPMFKPQGLATTPMNDIWLMPGEFWVGRGTGVVRTLLGSCVAVVFWHPFTKVGAMCHFLLPHRAGEAASFRDGQYADEALSMMNELLSQQGAHPQQGQAWVFGGANTLEGVPLGSSFDIGRRNIEAGLHGVAQMGAQLVGQDVGGRSPRTVVLNLLTGEVQCKGTATDVSASPPLRGSQG